MERSKRQLGTAFSAILGGSSFVFACRLTGAVLTLTLQVLLARWMGASELGVYVLAFSWCVLLGTLSQLGFVNATVRVIGQALARNMPGLISGYLRRGRQIVISSTTLAALAGAIIILAVGTSLPGGNKAPYLLAMALIPILALINFHCSIAVAFRWLPLAFVPTEVVRPIAIVAVVTVLWLYSGQLSATDALLTQAAVMVLILFSLFLAVQARLRNRLHDEVPTYETSIWVRTALPLLLISLFSSYFPELMLILLGGIVPSDQIAIFNASYRLALVVTFGLNAIDSVTSPMAARLFVANETAELQRMVTRATQLGFFGSMASILGFYFLGDTLLSLFGPQFSAGYETLMILVLAQAIRSAAGPVMSLLSVTGNQHRCLVVLATALVASAILTLVLAPRYGIQGAAMAVLIVTAGWSIWLHLLVRWHIGIRPSIFGALGGS
jgi:O-antigen/teichoic acid export membrane protein